MTTAGGAGWGRAGSSGWVVWAMAGVAGSIAHGVEVVSAMRLSLASRVPQSLWCG